MGNVVERGFSAGCGVFGGGGVVTIWWFCHHSPGGGKVQCGWFRQNGDRRGFREKSGLEVPVAWVWCGRSEAHAGGICRGEKRGGFGVAFGF